MHKILKRVSLWKNILYVEERLKRLALKVYANILHCGFSLTFVCVYLGEPSQKKPTFFADISAKAFSPPPRAQRTYAQKCNFFSSCTNTIYFKAVLEMLNFFPQQKLTLSQWTRVFPPSLNGHVRFEFFFFVRLPLF